MSASRPPFRADHVGSLLRPQALLEARKRAKAGEIDAAALQAAEDAAVREIIALQEDVGLIAITDGEARRDSWHMDYIYRIGGIEKQTSDIKVQFHSKEGDIEFTPSALRVTGKLALPSTIFERDFLFLRDNIAAGSVAKLTIPSPSMVHYRGALRRP